MNTKSALQKNENRPLQVGFVPLVDCAPLAMAQELGLFENYGIKVQLRRELGWATIRDKIIYGELDAAHAVSGMPFAATFGTGSIKCECVTGLVLSLHGNAITLSSALREDGVRDVVSLREKIIKLRGQKTLTFGVVFPFSSHNFLLRQWFASGGIDPDHDVRIVVLPPAQMVANLKAGNLDGYCVGEPWNSLAVRQRLGWCAAISAELAPGHPEKVLVVRRQFAEKRMMEHLPLIAALLKACAYCDETENAEHVAGTLARPEYLNLPVELIQRSFSKTFDFGCERIAAVTDFQIFHRHDANEPSQEKAAWVLRSIIQSGLVPRSSIDNDAARRVFRPDIFEQARKINGHASPHEPVLNHV